MLSKVVAWAPDRAGALRALDAALAETAILGVITNVGFLRTLLAHPDVVAGRLDTGLVERLLADPAGVDAVPEEVLAAAALVLHHRESSDDPWDVADGWRLGERAWTDYRYAKVRGTADDAEVEVNGHSLGRARLELAGGEAVVTVGGISRHYVTASDHDTVWLAMDGHAWPFHRHEPGDPADRASGARGGDGVVRSPMPGTVLVVKAAEGDRVTAGQPLLVVEAMKMEHTVTAPADGLLAELRARPGQTVELDAVLAKVTPCE
jgi:acetyl-CoA/propionyl-CoA carboxylase, biotin carboxylase, biotin carboxyl carrier protein